MPITLLYDYALRLIGLPYRWGGDDPLAGFDCSGLTIEILQAAGVLPKGYEGRAQDLFHLFQKNQPEACAFATLLFFGKSIEAITHIGFGMSRTHMLEAGGGGAKTLTLADAIAQNAYTRLRPIRFRTDLVAMAVPPYTWEGSKYATD